jgi:exopolysaccharide production protein ExoZ
MKLRTVQMLRAIAALAVLVCHLHSIESTKAVGTPLISELWINGAAGVDLFFVISGFIMVWVAGEGPLGPKAASQFLFARIARIYPLWWLFAGAMALYFFATYGQAWDPERIGGGLDEGVTHLVKSVFLLPQAEHPVLGVGWTLVHEMYFYVVFALMVLLVPAKYRLLALLVWGIVVASGAVAGLSDKTAKNFVELAFYPMSIQFLLGALTAYAVKAGWRKLAPFTAVLGLVSLIVVFVTFNFKTGGALVAPFELADPSAFTLGWGRTLMFGIPAALLLHGLVCLELDKGIGRYIPTLAVRIGDWSYALYLCHILLLSAVARIYFPLVGNVEGRVLDNLGFILVAATASILVSWMTYELFEKPVIGWYRKARTRLFGETRPTST